MTNARNLANRSTDFVSVRDFGARGDGVTDDTAAINAALAVGEAFFPSVGPWMINSTLVVTQNNTRMWSDCNAVIKLMNSAPYTESILSINNKSSVLVENLTFNSNCAYRSAAQSWTTGERGILITGGSNYCKIRGVTILDCGIGTPPGVAAGTSRGAGEGIMVMVLESHATDTRYNTVENCLVFDPLGQLGFGLRMWMEFSLNKPVEDFARKVRNNIFHGNVVVGTSWNAIEIAGCATVNNAISDNISYACIGNTGIEADKGASYNTFTGNIVDSRSWDSLTANDCTCFRDQGDPGGAFPARYATGNVWANNLGTNIIKGPAVSNSGMIIRYSKNAVISNLSFTKYVDTGATSSLSRGIQMLSASGTTINGLMVDMSACTYASNALDINAGVSDVSINNFTFLQSTVSNTYSAILYSSVPGLKLTNGLFSGAVVGIRLFASGVNVTEGLLSNVTFRGHTGTQLLFNTAGASFSGRISGCSFLPSGGSAMSVADWTNIIFENNNQWTGSLPLPVTVASAASITLPRVSNTVKISGTTGITDIVATGWNGQTVNLIFTGALTVTDGSNLKLNGNFTTTADDVLTLTCDGTNWYEIARSAN